MDVARYNQSSSHVTVPAAMARVGIVLWRISVAVLLYLEGSAAFLCGSPQGLPVCQDAGVDSPLLLGVP